MSSRVSPSRLELINQRRRLQLFLRIKKTLVDARNSTIQRIRALIAELERDRAEIAASFSEISELYKMAVAKEGIDRVDMLAEITPKVANVVTVNRGMYLGLEVENYGKYPIYSLMAEAPELDLALVKMRELLPKLLSFAEKETLFYALLNRVREYQRMINAIDYVIVPRIQDTIRYITLALEEQEREDFIRRKIITSFSA
ncbi:V-type ATP synthase subunit D [Thermoproteus tenax]|uniref:A1A0 ATP synthase, subunit D, V-type n=1 Tax=Thermoproteus tenax (strain ATCC 35583 / DSM 2078 / JCM 9277 / NBRC 100435 / Kra 1) TaxID=768679 RepID=G4RPD1_THETK|nr:V-type ATP synthase subunit D [Thermoproteus tenax]CCC81426.1 A1A0 ATP synthase, subunit D, V-type [Thermoproteus tenax Kra 1]